MNLRRSNQLSLSPGPAGASGGAAAGERASVLVIVLLIAFGLISVTLYFANSMSLELRASDNRTSALSADQAAKKAMEHGMRQVEVYVKGPGAGREQAIRSLQAAGLEVSAITDVTPVPHNGCRPPKRRRV